MEDAIADVSLLKSGEAAIRTNPGLGSGSGPLNHHA
jgi:hypothetical protein